MDTTKDEFNIPNIIVDPRTRTQYSKGKFLGKVCRMSSIVSTYMMHCFIILGWLCSML